MFEVRRLKGPSVRFLVMYFGSVESEASVLRRGPVESGLYCHVPRSCSRCGASSDKTTQEARSWDASSGEDVTFYGLVVLD